MPLFNFNKNEHAYNINSFPQFLYEKILIGFDFNIFTIGRDYNINTHAVKMLDWFIENITDNKYISLEYNKFLVWNNDIVVFAKANNEFLFDDIINSPTYEGDFLISGKRDVVVSIMKQFEEEWKKEILSNNEKISMVYQTSNGGIAETVLRAKKYENFYPEFYPQIDDVDNYINDFLQSSSNILILLGSPGSGKSSLIGRIISKTDKTVKVVYDQEVMKNEELYIDFIRSNEGAILILEDADIILEDRILSTNEVMSKLLNISDGIIDTSNYKIIITANIENKNNIDSALTRPGRCFDILEFRDLTRDEALTCAERIGIELTSEKDAYSVAEIFNNREYKTNKRKVGF